MESPEVVASPPSIDLGGESMPCPACSETGTVVLAIADGSTSCPACRGHGRRFISRPVATVVHVPTLRVTCGCGRTYNSPDEGVVKEFQRKHEAPPIECGCGRIVIGMRRLVLA